jgi:hypothetical protein
MDGKMKTGRILDLADGGFGLEYDNTVGSRNTMRLDARTYEKAVREAKVFLDLDQQRVDPDGITWEIE